MRELPDMGSMEVPRVVTGFMDSRSTKRPYTDVRRMIRVFLELLRELLASKERVVLSLPSIPRVCGTSCSGLGVQGNSSSGSGIKGYSKTGYGVEGIAQECSGRN